MHRWITRLDAACAWVNPALVIAALALAVLDVAVAEQHWTPAHSPVSAPMQNAVIVAATRDQCATPAPPELRDMAGRD
jgi:hypothetical protein